MPGRVVTALSWRGAADRVAVELDGEPWRRVPREAVATAGLAVGVELDASELRALARRSCGDSTRCAAVRERFAIATTRRVARAQARARGVAAAARRRDARHARRGSASSTTRGSPASRAQALAERGSGDLLIARRPRAAGRRRRARAAKRSRRSSRSARAPSAIVARRGGGPKTCALPRARVHRGHARAARCRRRGRRRDRMSVLHPTFLLHRAHFRTGDDTDHDDHHRTSVSATCPGGRRATELNAHDRYREAAVPAVSRM